MNDTREPGSSCGSPLRIEELHVRLQDQEGGQTGLHRMTLRKPIASVLRAQLQEFEPLDTKRRHQVINVDTRDAETVRSGVAAVLALQPVSAC